MGRKSKIVSFSDYKVEESNSSDGITRRQMLSKLGKVAAGTAIAGLSTKTLYDELISAYTLFDNINKDATQLTFSRKGKKFAKSFYKNLVTDLDGDLETVESELVKIFNDWSNKAITVRLNQKMYDSLVLIMLRIGKTAFRMSEFIQDIKKSDYKTAISKIESDTKSRFYIGEKEEFIRKYELMLFSSFDKEIQKRFILSQEEIEKQESILHYRKEIIQKILSVAEKYIGQEEIRGNRGFTSKDFEDKMKSVGWKRGDSWCSYFVEMVVKEAIGKTDTWKKAKRNFHGSTVLTYANFRLSRHFKVSTKPRVGSIVVWSYGGGKGHIGIVCSVTDDDNFTTIEGNTTVGGSPEGTEVRKKHRHKNNGRLKLLGFIYLV